MRLPGFLIIGAQKAGTTTLYRDLLANPAIFFPIDKEPGNLCQDDVLTDTGRSAYARHFAGARSHQTCGEATTSYTKRPDIPGVPARARHLLSDKLKVIYLVREPISRIISHHHHELTSGQVSCGIDEAVRTIPRYIDYSRYAMQITPWLNELGRAQVLIIHFECYIETRVKTLDSVCKFLGVAPRPDTVCQDIAYNRSAGKPVPVGPLAAMRMSSLYRRFLRPLLSASAKDKIRAALLPKATAPPDRPAVETVRLIVEEVGQDVAQLTAIMDQTEPLWNLQEECRLYERQQTEESHF
ncbi:MAG: sulfotransferase domain-containing protein [Phycisphaerales bacterium]